MHDNKPYFNFSIPNIMTIFRIILTPLFVFLLLKNRFNLAIITFIIAAISDGLDGFWARYFDQTTVLGTHLDPLADKILLFSVFVCLPVFELSPYWFTLALFCREFLFFLGVIILIIKSKNFKIKPTILGKLNTIFQIIFIFESLLILINSRLGVFHFYLFCITIFMIILSTIQYICIWLGKL